MEEVEKLKEEKYGMIRKSLEDNLQTVNSDGQFESDYCCQAYTNVGK